MASKKLPALLQHLGMSGQYFMVSQIEVFYNSFRANYTTKSLQPVYYLSKDNHVYKYKRAMCVSNIYTPYIIYLSVYTILTLKPIAKPMWFTESFQSTLGVFTKVL